RNRSVIKVSTCRKQHRTEQVFRRDETNIVRAAVIGVIPIVSKHEVITRGHDENPRIVEDAVAFVTSHIAHPVEERFANQFWTSLSDERPFAPSFMSRKKPGARRMSTQAVTAAPRPRTRLAIDMMIAALTRRA